MREFATYNYFEKVSEVCRNTTVQRLVSSPGRLPPAIPPRNEVDLSCIYNHVRFAHELV